MLQLGMRLAHGHGPACGIVCVCMRVVGYTTAIFAYECIAQLSLIPRLYCMHNMIYIYIHGKKSTLFCTSEVQLGQCAVNKKYDVIEQVPGAATCQACTLCQISVPELDLLDAYHSLKLAFWDCLKAEDTHL